MFRNLAAITERPALYSLITTAEMWTDPHIAERMLAAHLDPLADSASPPHAFIDRSAAWITDRFGLGPGVRVADFGCGPGLFTARFAGTGADVTGVDVSAASLDRAAEDARAAGLGVRYLRADYRELRGAGPFDLVTVIMRDYAALPPEGRAQLLATVRHHLDSGGALLFDVDAASAFDAVRPGTAFAPGLMDGFWSPRPYFGFRTVFRYPDERVALERFDIVEQDRTRTFCNWTAHFTPEQLAEELAGHGFAAEELLGDVAGAPYSPSAPQFAVVARPQ
ncbi:SAM-dependent methyltransferase [Nocardiopsis coralliicola]